MITLNQIGKKLGKRVLFDDVNASFSSGNRYGLTGPNGAGKSTLLKIIVGLEEASSGTVSLPRKVGFLKQNIEDYNANSVRDVVIMGNDILWNAMTERDRLYGVEMTEAIGIRLGEIEEIIADEDGYSADSNAESLLDGMGIAQELYDRKMETIPMDLRFRALLCQALFGNPSALILDEPTNHLDLESIGWLEKFLFNYTGTLIVVSHDRHFLNAVTTHIADIDYETIIIYTGNYDEMLVAKTAVRERVEHENKAKEKKVAHLREFIARFSAGTRASQVQSRIREIDRLQPQELKKSNIQRPFIHFGPPEKASGKTVFKIKRLEQGYQDNVVISNFSCEISKGDKVGVIGANGLGKTTLLKTLAQVLPPKSGTCPPGHQVSIGYFPQNHEEAINKRQSISAFDWLKARQRGTYDQDIRGALGKMLFSKDEAFKAIKKLSGGETARLIFALLMLQNHNTLILDEPNNHLDLESVSALSLGLSRFTGTLLFATHDRDLIKSVATKLIVFSDAGPTFFPGTFEDYLAKHPLP